MYIFNVLTAHPTALFSFLLTYTFIFVQKRGTIDEIIMSLDNFFFY